MAQIKILKINSEGLPEEHGTGDDLTFGASVTIASGGSLDVGAGDMVLPNAIDGSPVEGSTYWDGDTLFVWDDTNSIWRPIGGEGAPAENLDRPYTAGGAVTAFDAVYINVADKVLPAQADAAATAKVFGFALTTQILDDPIVVRTGGCVDGALTGATAGDRYFLSDSAAGGVSTTIPTGTGNRIIQVGYAKNATTLEIQFQFLGRRA